MPDIYRVVHLYIYIYVEVQANSSALQIVPVGKARFVEMRKGIPISWDISSGNHFDTLQMPADARCGFHAIVASRSGGGSWARLTLSKKVSAARAAAEELAKWAHLGPDLALGQKYMEEKELALAAEYFGLFICLHLTPLENPVRC